MSARSSRPSACRRRRPTRSSGTSTRWPRPTSWSARRPAPGAPAPRCCRGTPRRGSLRLNGVAAAGTLSDVDVRGALARSVPINDPLAAGAIQLPMKAASPGLFRAVRAAAGHRPALRRRPLAPRRPRPRARAQRRPPPRHRAGRPAARDLRRRSPLRRDRAAGGRAQTGLAAGGGDHARGHGTPRVRPAGAGLRAGRDPHRRRRPDRAPGARGPEPQRPRPAEGRRPARSAPAARRREERPQRALPAPRRRLAPGRGDRDRQRHARLGARARRRDRPAPRPRRRASPHRRAVPAREHRDGARRRADRREPRDARDRRRVGEQDLDPRPRPLGPARRARSSAR